MRLMTGPSRQDASGGSHAALLWRAYEHVPGFLDPLVHLARRHLLPALRSSLTLRRLSGPAHPDGRSATLVTAGASMTLDHLTAEFFRSPPAVEMLGPVTRAALPDRLERLGAESDLVLACLPTAWAPDLNSGYLRLPALIGASVRIGASLEDTLAPASRTVRADVRLAQRSGYSWHLATDRADFERFYDAFYLPFIHARFGALGSPRGRFELRREFRHGGAVMWISRDGRHVAGEIVRIKGKVLQSLAEAIDPAWAASRAGPQVACDVAAIELAVQHGLEMVHLGGAVPSLTNGIVRKKCAWGAVLAPWQESHRDILLRWHAPLSASVRAFLHRVAPVFALSQGLAAVTAETVGTEQGRWRQLRAPGIHPLLVLGGKSGSHETSGWTNLPPDLDAGGVQRAALAVGAPA